MTNPALKLSVLIFHPSYGGNGGVDSEHPHIREWAVETILKMKADPRVGEIWTKTIGDTPLTMSRNRAITLARELGAHLLLSVDSDQSPCAHAGEPWFRPFWDVAFNYIYENYGKGPNMIMAPYVGPAENVYCFTWRSKTNDGIDSQFSLEQYTREEASLMTGVQDLAAGPTGMFLLDMRCCELIEPVAMPKREILERVQTGQMSVEDAIYSLREGWFYYEFENQYADKKASTEDVTFTRDLSLAGIEKLGYNPVKCAWDSWIGHWKPRNCKRPQQYGAEHVGATLRRAVLQNRLDNEVIMDLDSLNKGDKFFESLRSATPSIIVESLAGHSRPNGKYNGNGEYIDKKSRTTTGRWFAHGHAPEEQQRALADVVRAEGYRKNRDLRILEIGSWLGGTAIAMADATVYAKVHCVDTWKGSATDITGEMAELAVSEDGDDAVFKKFCSSVGDRLDRTIFPFRGTSADESRKYWEPFDIIFIDAEHTYEACKADILNWWPHLRDDGIMLGHDFATHGYDGVTQAVKEIFGEQHSTFGWHPQGCMWRVEKKDHPELLEKHLGLEAV